MGPVSAGQAGPLISELRELLDIVSDPAKVKKALADLDQKSKEIVSKIVESQSLDAMLSVRADALAKRERDIADSLIKIDEKNFKNADLLVSLESKILEANKKTELLNNGLESLKNEKDSVLKDLEKKSSELDSKLLSVDKSIEENKVLKEELDSKLAKIKLAIG